MIARHGETDYNVKGIIQGQRQSKLTKNGVNQAKALSERLKNKKIDYIYTSTLYRAIDTAKIVNRYHKLKMIRSKKLNERAFGTWEGEKGDDMRKKCGDNIQEKINFKPKGAESWKDVEKRAVSFIKSVIKKHKGKIILIVAHKGPNRVMLNHFMKRPLKEHCSLKQDPASLNIISIEGKKVKIKINDVRHLKGLKIIKENRLVV